MPREPLYPHVPKGKVEGITISQLRDARDLTVLMHNIVITMVAGDPLKLSTIAHQQVFRVNDAIEDLYSRIDEEIVKHGYAPTGLIEIGVIRPEKVYLDFYRRLG